MKAFTDRPDFILHPSSLILFFPALPLFAYTCYNSEDTGNSLFNILTNNATALTHHFIKFIRLSADGVVVVGKGTYDLCMRISS